MLHETSKLFKALANNNRLAIFEYLRRQEVVVAGPNFSDCCNVGDVAQQFDLALSTVSHHLRVLDEAALIKCERRGQHTICTVNWETVKELGDFFALDSRSNALSSD